MYPWKYDETVTTWSWWQDEVIIIITINIVNIIINITSLVNVQTSEEEGFL